MILDFIRNFIGSLKTSCSYLLVTEMVKHTCEGKTLKQMTFDQEGTSERSDEDNIKIDSGESRDKADLSLPYFSLP